MDGFAWLHELDLVWSPENKARGEKVQLTMSQLLNEQNESEAVAALLWLFIIWPRQMAARPAGGFPLMLVF